MKCDCGAEMVDCGPIGFNCTLGFKCPEFQRSLNTIQYVVHFSDDQEWDCPLHCFIPDIFGRLEYKGKFTNEDDFLKKLNKHVVRFISLREWINEYGSKSN
jgi:hypothetical protein